MSSQLTIPSEASCGVGGSTNKNWREGGSLLGDSHDVLISILTTLVLWVALINDGY